MVTVMTFCGNDIQQNNRTANMYVAEELWSLCWKRFYYSGLHNKNSIQKNAEQYAKPREV